MEYIVIAFVSSIISVLVTVRLYRTRVIRSDRQHAAIMTKFLECAKKAILEDQQETVIDALNTMIRSYSDEMFDYKAGDPMPIDSPGNWGEKI